MDTFAPLASSGPPLRRLRPGFTVAAAVSLFLTSMAWMAASAAPSAAAGAVWYVSAAAPSDPTCAAASQANPFATIAGALGCAAGGDVISVGKGTFTGGFIINANVTLTGAGAGTVIHDPGAPTFAPNITIGADHSVTLQYLTIDGGQAQAGVVASSGALNLVKVTVQNTLAQNNGGGVDVEPPVRSAAVTVFDSTFSNDLAFAAGTSSGGAIYVSSVSGQPASSLSVFNSTLTGNSAAYDGGGVLVSHASADIVNSTIANNSAGTGGGGIAGSDFSQTVTLGNDVLAANKANTGPDCFLQTLLADSGHNLLGQPGAGQCAAITQGNNGDQVGTAVTPLDPVLGPLAANGGPTKTRALLTGSPAIGTGDANQCQSTPIKGLDQRSRPRNAATRGVCDIGAYDTGGA